MPTQPTSNLAEPAKPMTYEFGSPGRYNFWGRFRGILAAERADTFRKTQFRRN